MIISDFIKNFNLHDSVLDKCVYNKYLNELSFEIDFCYWAQEKYKDGEPENGIIDVTFLDVSDFHRDDYEIDNDSIINLKETEPGKIILTVETDTGDIHIFSFTALSVKIKAL